MFVLKKQPNKHLGVVYLEFIVHNILRLVDGIILLKPKYHSTSTFISNYTWSKLYINIFWCLKKVLGELNECGQKYTFPIIRWIRTGM